MPCKVNEFFEAGREVYLKEMDGVISDVADIVGTDLAAAKKRIATGQDRDRRLRARRLPNDLKKVGAEAAEAVGDQFEQLESDVDGQAGRPRRRPRDEVRRGAQGPRRGDRGAAGREQGPGGQGEGRHQGRRSRRSSSSRTCCSASSPGRPARSARSSRTRSASSATSSAPSRPASSTSARTSSTT